MKQLPNYGFHQKYWDPIRPHFSKDPMYRKWHQNEITFSLVYAFTENFMLPFSHDEVVYGKESLVGKMPGDEWQRFANLRLLFSYMFMHPGTNLIFQGGEFGQTSEWNFAQSLDWHLTEYAPHKGIQETIKALNHLYKTEKGLTELQFDSSGFEWIDASDAQNAIMIFARKSYDEKDTLIVALNMTPVPRTDYRIGVKSEGSWTEVFNSDATQFWGSGKVNATDIKAEPIPWQGRPFSKGGRDQ